MNAPDAEPTLRIERRKLRDLIPFPTQQQYFGDLSDHELAALADDIRRNGLRQPPEILPANNAGLPPDTVVTGHQRIRALRRLGDTVVDTIVRDDLAEASLAQITRAFLEPNANRRQLSMLAKARVAQALFASERGKQDGDLSDAELYSARDRVGRAIGVSGRHLDRFMRILRTPLEVQAAVEAGTLPIVTASQVANLKPREQAAIAKAARPRRRTALSGRKVFTHPSPPHDRHNARAAAAVSRAPAPASDHRTPRRNVALHAPQPASLVGIGPRVDPAARSPCR